MKKIILLVFSTAFLGTAYLSAQSWVIGGNTLAANSSFGSNNGFAVLFESNGLERGRLTAAGLWGFGTTVPSAKVHVNSAAGENAFRAQVNGSTKLLVSSNGGVSVGSPSTGPANGLFVSGNAGIGTTTPATKLHVTGGLDASPGGGGFIVSGLTTGANIAIDDNEIMARSNGVASTLFLNHNGSNLIINGTNAAGNVGIGTTAPGNRLHVKQNVANRAIEWQHESNNNFWTLGIGTVTNNARFEFNGVGKGQISSSDGAYSQISDARLKEDVEPVNQLLEKVMQLKPSRYYYKDSRSLAKNKSIGFIAQEVEKVFPELVHEEDGGYKWLNYSEFAVLAIKAIQEQQTQIEKQQQTNNDLQQQINELKTMINRLTSGKSSNAALSSARLGIVSPNPVKGSASIQYSVPEGSSRAQLIVSDAAGRTVKTLQLSGSGTLNLNTSSLAAGVYHYALVVDEKVIATHKMTVIR